MKTILSIILCLVIGNSYADNIFPPQCKPVVLKDATLILDAPKPSVIMIHNVSNKELWITHPASQTGASSGWSSRLNAGNWSALALRESSFELTCIESKPGHEQRVPCAGVISVCAHDKMTLPENLPGTFWAGEDMELSALNEYIAHRGFE